MRNFLEMYGINPVLKREEEQLNKAEEQELSKSEDFVVEDNLEKAEIEELRNILIKSQEYKHTFSILENYQTNDLIKSIGRSGLTAKKITIHNKDGSTHQAIRWVREGGNASPEITNKTFHGAGKAEGASVDEKLKNFLHSDASNADKIKELIHHGIYEAGLISKLTGAVPAQIYGLLSQAGVQHKEFKDDHNKLRTETGEKTESASGGGAGKPKLSIETTLADAQEVLSGKDLKSFTRDKKSALAEKYGITMQDRWDSYELGAMQVVRLGTPKSLLAFGTGGVGKTYTLSNKDTTGVLDRLGLTKFDPDIHDPQTPGQWDWAEIGGAMSKTEIWKNLYENKDKLVVFDDCDSQWDDDNMVNILKKILDSSGDGLVSYSGSTLKDEDGKKITQFKFTGRVIFISNLTREDLVKKGAGPIVSSRSMAIDLTMNRQETLDRVEQLADKVKVRDADGNIVPIGKEERDMSLEVMREFINEIGEDQLNMRVFNNLASKAYFLKQLGRLDKKTFWKEAVLQLI